MHMRWNRDLAIWMLTLLPCTHASSQEMELGIQHQLGVAHNQGMELAMNGWSLDATYLHPFFANAAAGMGLELGYTTWGSQCLLSLNYRHGQKHFLDLEFLHGMALYQQGPQYVVGLGCSYAHGFFNARNGVLLSAGIRFSAQPAYRKYSPLYGFFDLPLRIAWSRSPK